MPIKHLVISGGGPAGLVEFGILKHLSINNIIKYENIESIYATSIGGFISLIYLLKFEWSWMDDFLIKRPWENLLNFTSYDYLNIFYSKGLFDKKFVISTIKPLLLAKDLSIDITLKELYEYTKIELHLFTSNLNKFKKVDLNYKTHPDLKVHEALMMTCSIPILIQPPYYNNEYYLDGGLFVNSPLNDCFYNENCDKSEILAFIFDKRNPIDLSNNFYVERGIDINTNIHNDELSSDMNIVNFIIYIFKTVFSELQLIENENSITIDNTINIALNNFTVHMEYWSYAFKTLSEREHLVNLGVKQAQNFIETYSYDLSNSNITDLSNSNIVLSDLSNTSF
jgi:hypothetical protein